MPSSSSPAAVVVGVDGSPGSRVALDFAVSEAALRGRPVRVVHAWQCPVSDGGWVVPVHEYEDVATRTLEEAVAAVTPAPGLPGPAVTGDLQEGHPAEMLLTAASDADLLVVGSRGRGGLTGLLLGSVGQHCATHAHCPVVVVPANTDSTASAVAAAPPVILVGVDGSAGSRAALDFAVAEALRRGGSVRAVHAWEYPTTYGDGWIGAAEEFSANAAHVLAHALTLAGETAGDTGPVPPMTAQVEHGEAATALLSASDDVDMLVVGSRGHGGFAGMMLGSVSRHCTLYAPCPVVIVRPEHAAVT